MYPVHSEWPDRVLVSKRGLTLGVSVKTEGQMGELVCTKLD